MIKRYYKIWESQEKRFLQSETTKLDTDILLFEEFAKIVAINKDNHLNYFYIESTNCFDRNNNMIFEGDIMEFDNAFYQVMQEVPSHNYEVVIANPLETNYIFKNIINFNIDLNNNRPTTNYTVTLNPADTGAYGLVVANIFQDLTNYNYD